MSEWKETILDEFVDSISETFKFNSEPVVFLNTSDILAGKVLHHNTSDPKTLPGQAKKRIKKGDFLFSEIRPINKRYARVTFDADNYVVSTKLMVLRSKGEIEPIYLEYFLTSDETLEYLQMIAEDRSGTFPQITFDIIKRLEISLPPIEEQQAIASILSSLDDKIDLLHRQNQTLEQMAETLYDAWFEESDFTSRVSDLIDLQNGYAFKSKSFQDFGEDRVLKIKNISGGIVDIETTDFVSRETVENLDEKFSISTGDILFAMTGAKIGKMGIIPKTDYKLWLNQRVGLFKEKYYGSRFLAYLHLKSDYGKDYIENTATGSAQPNISGTGIENCEFPEVSEQEIIDYSNQLAPLYEKVIFNLGQIQKLEALRNTLLPKLMSGEIRIDTDE